MKKKNFGYQLLCFLLSLTLGVTSTASLVHANDSEPEFTWEKVENFDSGRLNKFEKQEADSAYDDDEEVRALIVFSDSSVMEKGYSTKSVIQNLLAKSYMAHLETAQDEMTEKISQEVLNGNELDVRYSFTIMTNGVSANLTYKEVKEIRQVEGVRNVYVLPKYDVQTDANPNTITSGEMVGSYNTWNLGYTGAGMRIAVIDTGLDMDHPSFDGGAFDYALQEQATKEGVSIADYDLLDVDEIASVLDELGAKQMLDDVEAADLFASNKVPFTFNYVDRDLDVTHDYDTQGDHGTHVAGISTSNKYVPVEGGYAPQENGVVGIAPNAQLMVMKVFGANGGAYADDYMVAIQDALLLGADAINLSLGSANGGESKETAAAELYINAIFEELSKSDTVVAISAGNAGGWADYSYYGALWADDVNFHTAGSPGSYTNAFTVASADNAGSTGYAARVAGAKLFYTETSEDPIRPFISLDTDGTGTEYDYVFFDALGKDEDYENVDVEGKIVFVKRGEISFVEKHQYAQEHGAVGIFVYNHEPGVISMQLDGNVATIPAASLTMLDGLSVKENSTKVSDVVYTGKVTISSEITTNYNADANVIMSDFSSWGVPGDLSLKPEITAPGGNIYSTLDNGAYGLMSGTSMASPSVAGMSALVVDYIEAMDLVKKTGLSARTLAQSLLMATATPLVEEDGEAYSPRKQGAGLANVEYAITSPVYILMDKNGKDGKVKAELGDDPNRNGVYNFGFTLYNMTDKPQYYVLDAEVLSEELIEDYFILGTSHALAPKINVKSNATLLYDLDQDGDVDKEDALIFLQVVNGSTENDIIASNETEFDFNDDGVLTTSDVHIFLQKIQNNETNAKAIKVVDSTHVDVTITLTDADKAYLDDSFVNGMYVDGFIYLNGKVDLSVPFLAFYGNWADPSMFEAVDYYNGYGFSYSDTYATNAFVDADGYVVGGNPYNEGQNVEDEYLPERNAISSEHGSVSTAIYTLIRNAAKVTLTVTDAKTGEVYKSVNLGAQTAEFFYEETQEWVDTTYEGALDWAVTDAKGNPLPEGCEVIVSVHALPTYYADSTTDPGFGTSLSLPLVVDNTAPEFVDQISNADGTWTIKAKDNRYTAAVVLRDRFGEVLSYEFVNQDTLGIETSTTIEVPKAVAFVELVDYAGNVSTYKFRINNTGNPDTPNTTGVTVEPEEATILVKDTLKLKAIVEPETVLDNSVEWSSSDDTIATVDEKGVVTGVKTGTVTIMATTNALDASGTKLTATCEITVKDFDQTFVGIGASDTTENWYKFNAMNADGTVEELRDLERDYVSATTFNNNVIVQCFDMNGVLPFEILDSKTLTKIASVDGFGIELFDMTQLGNTSYVAGVYGSYVIWFDTTDVLNSASMINLAAYLDAKETEDGKTVLANLNGISYVGSEELKNGDIIEYVAVTTTFGDVYEFSLLNEKANTSRVYSPYQIGKILSTNQEGQLFFGSLIYDAERDYYFWSVCDSSFASHFYAFNINNKRVEYLGKNVSMNYYGLLPATMGADLPVTTNVNPDTTNWVKIAEEASSIDSIQKIEVNFGKGVND